MRKVGIEFPAGIGFDPDLTGLADTLSLKYKLEGTTDFTDVDGDFAEIDGDAGAYTIPVTINDAGSYLFVFESTDDRISNKEVCVTISNASIDDVKVVVDNLTTTLDSVKEQVDLLDEETVNGISAKVDDLSTELKAVHSLINDSTDVMITIAGDETGIVEADETITGDTSGATGVAQYVEYDSDADVTKVTLKKVEGTFETDETVNDGTDSTTGKITEITNNVVNSVLEFVETIKASLGDGATSNLESLSLDIEHLIKGDDKLEDDSDCPTAGKGLVAIYDLVDGNKADIAALSTSVSDKFDSLTSDISDARTSIEAKIDAMNDADDENSLISKVNAAKAVVDANKAYLEDSGYGLSALKDLLDAANTDTDDILAVLNDADNGIIALKDTLMDKLNSMDAKLDDINSSVTGRVFI